ncbi:hypothetical protein A2533_04340 [Candidatus Falkowbacteria bacterium RIFOXYD2_FULL_35_9]|uniref:Isoleucine--tRNA ligase n=1 Tax=Candidatus Falkowbacteria bacterium RIFOXYC2_FULL_36_12 TaxID=1798002 RepID=A0A1F5T4B2_9BACT|nr:MAG: hypothetical protein A2300_03870 [Candidatus Falkowbacteria bacterium RIFOXYB2_FULL_35_7]OGF33526.1 MAG: hypothetical protein A2478_02490 [Candidatus Falkowbacteria bacterium RIFOXYC2_FULL_36_12]OGF34196.1 MAG: hypothetical protein A2223_01185 [Candidatus Falkowbacteria bacterium RIFOXYA2_FULL_35_8]OGF45699.1 MAG: hypothetical protein A2533_04340 [Candidatus Falkowbacteria bacterium RIFOXYD2_FULL_35_9]
MSERKSFVQIEEELMNKWDEEKTFEKSVENRDPDNSFVFYDGPPFATGLPHYGHIVPSTMKDIVPRYFTMKGKRVERRWGWDCHGLPIENLVEKEMHLNSRKDIEKFGVGKFNDACESKIGMYAEEWKHVIKRLGRWVDMENDYKTKDLDFMESVWWVFSQLYKKNLVYEGYKSLHVCPRCETTLSQNEVAEGYKDVKDLSVTAEFELVDEPRTYVLAWTTTPWTLPGNVALAVGPDVDYVKIEKKNESVGEVVNFILAKERLEDVFKDNIYEIVSEFKGKELEGKKYKPLFDYSDENLENKENLYSIVTADFVTTEDGTGVVHIAPAFGEDDLNLGKEKKLSFIQHVGMDGRFTQMVKEWVGEEVKPKEDPTATDLKVLKYLAEKGLLFSKEKYEHSYPHCWRCDSPLLNYATSSWFVKVTELKPRMLELAKEINWMPKHLKEGRFGQWLEGARDWSISRTRYWGNPMPVWKCENCEEIRVVGSINELETLSGVKVENLHKQYVDKIEFPCEKCGENSKRIPEVLDCWFESGSMPYGQQHYPFEKKEKFELNFPAEFIAEGVDQTRAWFYVLHVLSTALFDKPAFKNVVANGIVLAEDGQKMSKRKNNYPDPMGLVDKYGADALRYYLTTSPVMKAGDINFSEAGVDEVYKKVILMSQNVLSFYQMFAPEKVKWVESENVLDKWIMSKLHELMKIVTESLEAYDFVKASKPIAEFINELSTWYIRRSRDRFKHSDKKEKLAAIATLKEVLEKMALIMAPILPFLSEHLWLSVGNSESVHLQDWPAFDDDRIEKTLMQNMEKARQIIELGLAARDIAKIKVRQPLQTLHYTGEALDQELEVIAEEELNVKDLENVETLTENKNWVKNEDLVIRVGLNIEIDENLRLEGYLRELVRSVNNLRKNSGLTIDDKVKIYWNCESKELSKVFENGKFMDELRQSTLASGVVNEKKELEFGEDMKINDEGVWVGLEKD